MRYNQLQRLSLDRGLLPGSEGPGLRKERYLSFLYIQQIGPELWLVHTKQGEWYEGV